jgi:hypothetical protein
MTREFFATVQNKMHYAAHKHTAAEVIYERVDSGKPTQFLDFAELQAVEEHAMTMANWLAELDRQLSGNRRELLANKGSVSHKQAVEKAEKEFETYRTREMKRMESDFDRAVKALGADGGEEGGGQAG